jgi:hypothetical protein
MGFLPYQRFRLLLELARFLAFFAIPDAKPVSTFAGSASTLFQQEAVTALDGFRRDEQMAVFGAEGRNVDHRERVGRLNPQPRTFIHAG